MKLHNRNLVMEVIDNFLDKDTFNLFQNYILSPQMVWNWNEYIIINDEKFKGDSNQYQFAYTFYDMNEDRQQNKLYPLIEPFLLKLKPNLLRRIKINLNPRTVFHRSGGYHTDFPYFPTAKTAVYYVNTNNGYTIVKGYGKVESVENRMVIFDSDILHTGVSCTDEKRRIVVNFNYG